jgi:hypothetical protein
MRYDVLPSHARPVPTGSCHNERELEALELHVRATAIQAARILIYFCMYLDLRFFTVATYTCIHHLPTHSYLPRPACKFFLILNTDLSQERAADRPGIGSSRLPMAELALTSVFSHDTQINTQSESLRGRSLTPRRTLFCVRRREDLATAI